MTRENGSAPRAGLVLILATLAALAFAIYSGGLTARLAGPEDRDLPARLAGQPWRAELLRAAAGLALSAGDPAAAITLLSEADARAGPTAAGSLALGDAHRLLRDWPAAIAAWTQARSLGSDPQAVGARLLEAYRVTGDYTAAIAVLRDLAALQPDSAAYQYQLGLLLAARQPDAALAPLLAAAALDPGLEESVRLLENGLAPDPAAGDPALQFFNAGRALAALSEWQLAAEAFRQAVLANPQYAEAWAFLGEASGRLGLDSSELFATALALNPDSLAVNLLYALHLRRLDRAAEALPYLARAALAAPGEPAVAVETAQAYAQIGDVTSALAQFARAVELAPDDPTYLHLLAQYSIYNEIQIEEVGLPAARAAVLQDPDDPIALDLIGYAYYLRGDSLSGLRFLHRALAANPGYAPARLHLGMVFLARGDVAAAAQQLRLAEELAPGTSVADQAREILQNYLP